MSNTTENPRIDDVIFYETPREYCREVITLAQNESATEDLLIGTVLSTSSSKKIACTTGSSTDSILLENVSAEDLASGDVQAVALVRGPAIVVQDALIISSNQLSAAVTALKTLNIIVRTQPDATSVGPVTTD